MQRQRTSDGFSLWIFFVRVGDGQSGRARSHSDRMSITQSRTSAKQKTLFCRKGDALFQSPDVLELGHRSEHVNEPAEARRETHVETGFTNFLALVRTERLFHAGGLVWASGATGFTVARKSTKPLLWSVLRCSFVGWYDM